MARFDLIAPFIAAIMFYAIAPLLANHTKVTVRRVIDSGQRHVGGSYEDKIPFNLAAESIEDYVDFAMDAVQVLPAFLLPIVGSVYTFSTATPTGLSVTLLLAAVVIAMGLSAWIMSTAPANYASRKWHGYSVVTLVGSVFNAVAIALVLGFS